MHIGVVHIVGGAPVKRLMFALLVVEVHPAPHAGAGVAYGAIGVEVDFFVFQAAPEAFDEDVVHPAPFAVHADLYAMFLEYVGEGGAGELAALVGVEDARARHAGPALR